MFNEYLPYILLVHAVICYVYLLATIGKKSTARSLFLLVFLLPFIGVIVALVISMIKNGIKGNDQRADEEENFRNTVELIIESSIKADRFDVVAMEEALMLNDHYVQRELINETVKYDALANINVLKRAKDTNDKTTREMVEKRLATIKDDLREDYKLAKKRFLKSEVNRENQLGFINAINRIIIAELEDLEEIELIKNERISILIPMVLTNKKDNDKIYQDLVDLLIEAKDFKNTEEWLSVYERSAKECEGMLICRLKFAYAMRDKKAFDKAVKRIMNAECIISEKTQVVVEYLCGWGKDKQKIIEGSIS